MSYKMRHVRCCVQHKNSKLRSYARATAKAEDFKTRVCDFTCFGGNASLLSMACSDIYIVSVRGRARVYCVVSSRKKQKNFNLLGV